MRRLAFASLALWFGAAASAQAALQYRAAARVEASVAGQTNQHVVLVDPPSGGFRSDTSDVRAGRELFLSGLGVFDTQIVAQGLASARGSANGLRAEVWSSQQQLNPFQGGSSNGHAEATLYFTTTVQGAPGSSGTVRLDTRMGAGVIPAPFGGTARSSYAGLSASAFLFAQTPGGPACRGSCTAQRGFSQSLLDGSDLLGFVDQAWSLEITAKAGDLLTLQLTVTVDATNGYGASTWFLSPWSNVSPFEAATGPEGMDAVPGDAAGLRGELLEAVARRAPRAASRRPRRARAAQPAPAALPRWLGAAPARRTGRPARRRWPARARAQARAWRSTAAGMPASRATCTP
jgi:hypothetical protein